MFKSIPFWVLLLCATISFAQEQAPEEKPKGQFSGNFMANTNFYFRDDKIGANTTQYLREKSSSEAWLFLNYKYQGFNFALRYDLFNNSPLLNPQEAYSRSGIGFWQVSKDIDKLNITVGNFYDQFGTGMVFRAYEDRLIGIDYAIQGARLIYNFDDKTRFKAFTGKQKFRFDVREAVIKGANLERMIYANENLQFNPGVSIVNRTIDANTMNTIAGQINSYPLEKRFIPKYNVYVYNVYNTLSFKNFSLYTEYAGKTNEAVVGSDGTLQDKEGKIYYGSLTWSIKGLGINAQYKRIESFPFRTSPLENLLNGIVNYLPSLTRQNTYRLLARYNAVVQELGETAIQGDIVYSPSKNTTFTLNYSQVNQLNGGQLFTEYYGDVTHKFNKTFKMLVGLQRIHYNQGVFELKPGAGIVHTYTPFTEITYKLTRRQSIRTEFQYLDTKQDLGSFINAMIEYNIAPKYSFTIGDMLNHKPNKTTDPVHYYTIFGAYTYKTSRFTLGYVKQVEGVNCTGGVCRIEPAFNGVKFTLSTNF